MIFERVKSEGTAHNSYLIGWGNYAAVIDPRRDCQVYADIAARYAETAPVPRYVNAFYTKYQDRLLYGTDMGMDEEMYKITFRILETSDEHFYETEQFGYHWPLYGFGLSNQILEKIYRNNALIIKDL